LFVALWSLWLLNIMAFDGDGAQQGPNSSTPDSVSMKWLSPNKTQPHVATRRRPLQMLAAKAAGQILVADRSANEHDLAGRSGFKNLLVRAGCFGEWQFLADDRAQSAVFEAGKDPGVNVCLFGRRNSP
jgi:hypothetical protein